MPFWKERRKTWLGFCGSCSPSVTAIEMYTSVYGSSLQLQELGYR